jgi:hypothetical protein
LIEGWGERTSWLVLFASKLANSIPDFYEKKGPGRGDRSTNEFIDALRKSARERFGRDYSEAKVCHGTDFPLDFYFPEEGTAVEFAFSLHQPMNEFERDIFKCLLAQDSGRVLRRLVFVCKPGGESKLSAPVPKAIIAWAAHKHDLKAEVFELGPEADNMAAVGGGGT